MINQEIADILELMGSYIDILDPKNGFFKSRAFRRAADVISSLSVDLNNEKFVNNPELLVAMEGIGHSIAAHIVEYLKTGKISEYENFKKLSPVKLEELLKIQGLGPKKILKLYNELNIKNIEDLQKAADEHLISKLAGFGEKSEQNILESLKFAITNKDKKPYFEVEPIVNEYIEYMEKDINLVKIEPLGSFRRKKDMIGDIDFLVISKSPQDTMKYFTEFSRVEKILGSGDTKSSVWLNLSIQADLRIIPENSWGAAMQYFTGSKDHNVKLRNIAINKGYKLSEYSLSNRTTDEIVESASEEKIYKILGLDYIIPELRENNGEVEAAISHNLPEVINLENITGDLHMHTTYSDGAESIVAMANAAKNLGYKYIGISDHVGMLAIAGAVQEDQFKEYVKAIREADATLDGIKIYAGAEVDLDKEGNYSFSESLLNELDYVIAAVHLSVNMDKDEMTKRLEKAIKNPLKKILAHPTGRLLGQRPSFEFDFEYIFKLCAEHNVAVEINADPHRLDLNDVLTKLAIRCGCKIEIGSDAHTPKALENIRYGVNIARRGWVTTKNLFVPAF